MQQNTPKASEEETGRAQTDPGTRLLSGSHQNRDTSVSIKRKRKRKRKELTKVGQYNVRVSAVDFFQNCIGLLENISKFTNFFKNISCTIYLFNLFYQYYITNFDSK